MYQTSRSKGQELVAQRMVNYFTRLGHEAYLITSIYHDGKEVVPNGSLGERGYKLVKDNELGIPVIRVPSLISKWPPRRILFEDVITTLERVVNDFRLNVLITHSTLWNGPEEVAKFIEWRRNIKTLGGFQDLMVFCHMSHYHEPSPRRYSLTERSFRMAWNRLALRTILRVANLVLVVTPYEEDSKVKMGTPKEKCFLFPGGIDDETYTQYASVDTKILLEQLNLPPDVRIISYLGTLEERKNPAAVLDVAEKLRDRKDLHFILAGRGDSSYGKELAVWARTLPNVTYLGEIDDRTKIQLLRASYSNLILSRMEALGLAQLEFMYAGVPVITSGVGGQSWIVDDAKDGIRVGGPNDIDGAARQIVELVNDTTKRDKLGSAAREKAGKFTLTNLIASLDAAITRVLEHESGLSELAPEVRSTLSEPEMVLKVWSHGTVKVIATSRRMFIQQGRLSRKTLEAPYSSIGSIGHIRRYNWRALLTGLAISLLFMIQYLAFPIFSGALTSIVVNFLNLLPLTQSLHSHVVDGLLAAPFLIGLIMFGVNARKGYSLNVSGSRAVYLSQSFSEAIQFIREKQDEMLPEVKERRIEFEKANND